MARPERNDIDYFPHSVDHGKKMYYLDENYGNDGYSVWFRTLEELGKANYHFLDFRDETQLMYMSSMCKVSEEKYIEIISVLVKFGEFDKHLWGEHQIMWNQKFVDSIKDAYNKRVNVCITLDGLYEKLGFLPTETTKEPPNPVPETHKQPLNPGEKGDGNPQSKVEYSKEEKSKEEDKGAAPSGPTATNEFYSNEFKKTEGHPLTQKYYHIIKYIYNLTPNIINDPGTHILKLKKQLSFEQYVKLQEFVANRPTAVIKDMIDSWLNNPKYSKDRISVYAVLHTWARKEPIQGTNLPGVTSKKALIQTKIGKAS